MSALAYVDYRHVPTLEDVALTESQKCFKSALLRREARTFKDLSALSKKRGWRFMAQSYAFKARALEARADYLFPF
jgi:hypothetical protein